MIKDTLSILLATALSKVGVDHEKIILQHPANAQFGDYTTNVALVAAKKLKKNPLELAQQIVDKLPKNEHIQEVKVAPPGFVNFYISKTALLQNLQEVVTKQDDYAKNDLYKGKNVMLEYTDPNPFKEFHIGHLYSNAVGESLSRLFEASGAQVRRVNYYGDVGMHVARSLWGLMKKMKEEGVTLEGLQKNPLKERINYLGQSYALGSKEYEKDDETKDEIKDINYAVYLSGQDYLVTKEGWIPQVDYKKYIEGKDLDVEYIKKLYATGKEWSLSYFEEIYKRLGTQFDGYYPESVVGEYGYKLVMDNLKKGIFKKSDGAIIFHGADYGLHTRVFINSLGLPTYEAKELGLAPTKYKDFAYDDSLIITGNEIKEYFKVLLAALKEISPDLASKTKHIGHGMVRLKSGKMSSRTGEILTGEWLLEEVKKRVQEIIKKSGKLEQAAINTTAERVAVGAVKYSLLKSNIGNDVVFDFDTTLSLEGNSGPYVQYTYTRAQSILSKSTSHTERINNYETLEKEEEMLLRTLFKFPEIVKKAAQALAPNLILNYLYDLASQFNLFYHKYPVIKADENIQKFRLTLTAAVSQVLKSGLHLLGIKTVDRM